MKRHTKDEALRLLRRHVDACGSQREFARRNGVSVQFVSDVLKGKREPTDRIMQAVGLRRVVYYETAA